MFNLTPAEYVPFLLAIAAAVGGMLFARSRDGTRPYSLVAAILYAIAVGCVVIGIWSFAIPLMR